MEQHLTRRLAVVIAGGKLIFQTGLEDERHSVTRCAQHAEP